MRQPTKARRLWRWWGFLRSLVIYLNPVILRSWRRFYQDLIAPGDLVIDVGAHMGTRTRAMRAVGARVIALEPQQLFASFLRRILPKDVVFIPVAAGGSQTTAEMAVSSRHPTVSSLRVDFVSSGATASGFERVRWDERQQVEVVTLDSLIERYGTPRYIKIDVEGFEEDVLRGLSVAVELISVEFLPGFSHLTHSVVDRLMGLGDYRFNPVVGETGRFVWSEWKHAGETKAWLDTLPDTSPSGDLFARLVPPGVAPG